MDSLRQNTRRNKTRGNTMKTSIIIDIETPDTYEVVNQEDGSSFDGVVFAKEFHKEIVEILTKLLDKDFFQDSILDGQLEEYAIENYDSFEDYKIEIKTKTISELDKKEGEPK